MRFCNNAAIAGDGTIWFSDSSIHYGIAQWKDDFVQDTRTGRGLQPSPKQTIRVQAYDDDGTLVADIDLDVPGYHMVTGVREHAGRVWMGSLHEPAVAVYDLA